MSWVRKSFRGAADRDVSRGASAISAIQLSLARIRMAQRGFATGYVASSASARDVPYSSGGSV